MGSPLQVPDLSRRERRYLYGWVSCLNGGTSGNLWQSPGDGAGGGRSQTRELHCGPTATDAHYDRGVPDCLFCGIAAGQIPATLVLDGKRVIAFRDIDPQAPTHVLVVPRDHFPNVAALAAVGGGLLDELVGSAREIAVAEGIEGSGYRIVFNTGQDGGQTVGHVHAHVLGGRPLTWPPG